jgi:hypothetical protein
VKKVWKNGKMMMGNENDDVRCKRKKEMQMMMVNKKEVKIIMGE